MADFGEVQRGGKLPRRLVPENMHYILHKVAEATVRDGAIVLSCVRDDGSPYYGGPWHPSLFKDHRGQIGAYLDAWGIEQVEDIKYVVAYHCGAIPNGVVQRLLRSEEEVQFLVARIIEARAHLAKSDGEVGVIVSEWRRRRPPSPGKMAGHADRPGSRGEARDPEQPPTGTLSVLPGSVVDLTADGVGAIIIASARPPKTRGGTSHE